MTKKLWITARFCPYNKPNNHNETILPGAFDQGKDIYREEIRPAFFTRREWAKQNAIEKTGYTLPVPMFVMHWMDDTIPVGVWTAIHDTPEGLFGYGCVAHEAAIENVKNGNLPEVSISFKDGERRDDRLDLFESARVSVDTGQLQKVYLPHIVTAARLVEVSLVTGGSFAGAEIKIVKEED